MFNVICDDVIETERMDSVSMDIYENDVGDHDFRTGTSAHQLQRTGSESVKMRISRAAPVCSALLCFLLLTAVIVLWVHIYTISRNYTQERDELLTNITRLRKERDGWICYKSSCYFISSEMKNWTESRRNCRERGADLTIINNREEQDFVKKISGTYVWIGLSDSDEEGRWKWVDGSERTSGFWRSGEPNGYRKENCAVSNPSGWADYSCDHTFQWICEKSF